MALIYKDELDVQTTISFSLYNGDRDTNPQELVDILINDVEVLCEEMDEIPMFNYSIDKGLSGHFSFSLLCDGVEYSRAAGSFYNIEDITD